nr:ABC transporter permease [Ardenticatena sp.]
MVREAVSEFLILFRMQLANWRWSWRGMLIGGIVVPLSLMFFARFTMNNSDSQALIYIITGNVMIGLFFTTLSRTASRFAFLCETRALDYYRTLIDSVGSLVLATMGSFLLFALPGVVITLYVGQLLFRIAIHPHPSIFFVFLVSACAFASTGAFIGIHARSYESATLMANLVNFVLAFLSPVMIPLERFPYLLRPFAWILPSTHAALAFRQALSGDLTDHFGLSIGYLLLFSVLVLFLVNVHLHKQ